MATRSMTAPSLSAPFVLAIVVRLAMLFAMMQSAGVQRFGQAQASHPAAAPLYRGVIQSFKGESAPADPYQTAVAQRMNRWQPYIAEAPVRLA